MGDEGLDPPSESSKKTDDSARGGAKSGALDPDLAIVADAWRLLTARSKAAIVGMAQKAVENAGRRRLATAAGRSELAPQQ
jgi:hypothetical protein